MTDDAPRYFAGSRAFADRDVIAPGEAVAVAIVEQPGEAFPAVGIAYPAVHLKADDERRIPPETGWRLVVRGEQVPGVWALRRGEFVELG